MQVFKPIKKPSASGMEIIDPFKKSEWIKELERESLKTLESQIFGIGKEQKRYSMFVSMLNYENDDISPLKLDIKSELFLKEFRMFADISVLPKVHRMTGNKITFEELFCYKEADDMNLNQKFFIVYMMLRWLKKTYFYNAMSSCISVYVNLKKDEYAIFKASCKAFKCGLNKNIISYLYDMIYNDICRYEAFSTEDKIKHLMKKLDIRCDFTKKRYSYQIDSHHIVIGIKCDKQRLLELLETTDSETMRILLQYFSVVSIFKSRIVPMLPVNVRYTKREEYCKERRTLLERADGMAPYDGFLFGYEYSWRYGRSIYNYSKNSALYIHDADIVDFLNIIAPACAPYMLNKLKSLEDVEIKIEGDEIVFCSALYSNLKHGAYMDSVMKHMILGAYEEKFILTESDNIRENKLYICMCNKGCRRYNYKYCLC